MSVRPLPFRLPPFGLGTAPLGNLYAEVPEAEAEAAVAAALEAGWTYLDTAPHYGLGLAEERLGRALAASGLPRDRYVLSTKVGRLLEPADPGEELEPQGFAAVPRRRRRLDYSADGVRRSLDESLARLGVDRVDIVYVHDPDTPEQQRQVRAEAYPALARLREEGVVGAVGVGMNFTEPLAGFVRDLDLDLILLAGRHTLLDRSALREGLLELCAERGTGVVVGGAFNSGLLADPRPGATFDYQPADGELVEEARRLARACEAHGVPLPAAALAYPAGHPAVVSVLVGCRTAAEVAANAGHAATPIPAGLRRELGFYTP
jgi:D-threo-aldose 1-dehydrogenase